MTSPTITADGRAQFEGTPDLAVTEAVAIRNGESASEARALVSDQVAALRDSVSRTATEEVQTVTAQIQDTEEMWDPATDAPFQARERLRISCQPDHIESVVTEVLDAGGQIEHVEFQLGDERLRSLQNEAIESAMKRAREKAEQIAAVEGYTVTGVQSVSTNDGNVGFDSIVDDALDSAADTDLNPAPITVSQGVQVIYEITDAE